MRVRNTILKEIILIIQNKTQDKSYNYNTKLSENSINSMQFLEIVVLIEKKFQIQFDDNMLITSAFSTVYDLASYVQLKIGD